MKANLREAPGRNERLDIERRAGRFDEPREATDKRSSTSHLRSSRIISDEELKSFVFGVDEGHCTKIWPSRLTR